MIINGEKTFLRAIEKEDNDMLLKLLNDPETERMLGGSSFPTSLSDQLRWFDGLSNRPTDLRCIVVVKATGQAVGTVILNDINSKYGTAQIHIKLIKEERGKGYAADAVNSLVKYAFDELRLNCVYAEILEYNKASEKLFEKCGFSLDGKLRARVYKGGAYLDVLAYSLLRSELDA